MARPGISGRDWWVIGTATAFVVCGAGLIWSGARVGARTLAAADTPEGRAFTPVQQMHRDTPATILGRRIVVGDSLAWAWVDQQDGIYAWPNAGAQEIADALLHLPREEPVDELVIWVGNDDLAERWDVQSLVPAITRILEALQPERYVIVAPLPVWSKDLSVNLHASAVQQLRQQFSGPVVNPHPTLQAALTERAPVYYDDFRLTAVGYAHVTNLVETAFGRDVPALSATHGIAEFGRMPAPVPAGLLAEGSYLDLPGQ